VVNSIHFNGKAHFMISIHVAKVFLKAVGGGAMLPSRIAPVDR
jgi:hypothetical protein